MHLNSNRKIKKTNFHDSAPSKSSKTVQKGPKQQLSSTYFLSCFCYLHFPFEYFFFQTGQFSWIRNIDKWTKKNKYTVFCINFILFFWIKFMRTNWRNNWLLLSCHKWNSIYFFAHWKLLVDDGKVLLFYDVWWPDTKFTKIGILLSSSMLIRCGEEFYNNRLSFSIDFTLIQVQIAVIFWRCPILLTHMFISFPKFSFGFNDSKKNFTIILYSIA